MTGAEAIGGSYVLSIYRNDTRHTVVVWNGVENYRRLPSPENLSTVNMGGLTLYGKVAIVQLNKPVGRKGRSALKTLATLLQSQDCVILWACDTKTYNSVRNELKANATCRFDGTPGRTLPG